MADTPLSGEKCSVVNYDKAYRMTTEKKFGFCEDQVAHQVGLTIPSEHREGVLQAFKALSDAAEVLFAFQFPDDVEPSPIFHPDVRRW